MFFKPFTSLFVFASLLFGQAAGQSWLNVSSALSDTSAANVNGMSGQVEEATVSQGTLAPTKSSDSLGVKLTASSAVVLDGASGEVLFQKDADTRRAMASLTKIMTAVVTLESSAKIDDTVLITKDMIGTEESNIGLEEGEEIRVRDLLIGALVASGNDAALALATYVGKDADSFVLKMNEKASRLGLTNTRFMNSHGLDAEGHFSSARDIAMLFRYAMNNKTFAEIVGIKSHEAHALNRELIHTITSTNKLFDTYLSIEGGKTGFTDNALFCFASVVKNSEGHDIVIVVFGSDLNGNQFQDTKALADWTFKNYTWAKSE